MASSSRIRDEDIADVRERLRIEDVVEPYTTLRRAGGDSMKGLCPFHDEKTPSFHVTPSRGLYYCYGCQAGGDAIGFLQEIDGLSFPDAVRQAAALVGIELREDTAHDPEAERRDRLYAALASADSFFRDQLATPEAAPARRELASRHFSADQAADAGCGYSPADGDVLLKHLRNLGYSDKELVGAGLAREGARGTFAFFRGRLMWPVADARGRVCGFGARRLSDDDPIAGKYVNSPESAVYHKSRVLYGLDQARKAAHRSGRVFVVEGYTDVMANRAAGFPETVATSGTAFGETHLGVLTRAIGEDTRVVFCFDGDAAGRSATAKAWHAAHGILNRAYGVRFPGGSDPCDLRISGGDAALTESLQDTQPLTKIVVSDLIDDTLSTPIADGQPDPESRSRAAHAVGALLAPIPDDVLRTGYEKFAAETLDVPLAAVTTTPTPDAKATAGPASPDRPPEPPPETVSAASSHLRRLERRMLRHLAGDPALAATWVPSLSAALFVSPTAQAVFEVIASAIEEAPQGMGAGAWAGRLLDHADPISSAAITRMLSEPADTGDATSLLGQGRVRLREHELVVALDRARAALAAASASSDEDALLDEVADLSNRLMRLRDGQEA